MKRKPLLIIGGIVVLLFLIILALPLFINVNQFKPTLETKLGVALGRKVGIGDIGLSIISGSVTVKDVSVADDPAYSNGAFLTAKSLDVGVAMMPLIFSRQLNVSSFTIEEPEITLLRNANGTWNYSTLGAAGQSKGGTPAPAAGGGAAPSATASGLSVEKLKISNGKMIVGSVGAKSKPSVYSNVNLEASDLSYTTQFPFKLTATGPSGADIKVEGKAGPINQTDTSATPLNATVNVEHMDLAKTGFIDPASGIAGIVDFNGDLNSDGKVMSSKGSVKTNKLKVMPSGAPSSVPLNVDYATDYTLKDQSGVLKQGDIHIGKALAHLTGNLQYCRRRDESADEIECAGNAAGRSGRVFAGGGSGVAVRVEAAGRNSDGKPDAQWSGGQAGGGGAGEHAEREAGGIQLEIEIGSVVVIHRAGRWGWIFTRH